MLRTRKIGLLVLGFAAGVGLTAWAAASIWESPEDTSFEVSEPLLVTVKEDSIGRSIRFSATASWQVERSVRSLLSGTLTSQHAAGAVITATSGSQIFSVDLVAATAMAGDVPAFRDMAEGDTGPDVAQLQQFLISQGYHDGEADGEFGQSTRLAVRAWEAERGYEADGIVQLGQAIFFADLPARLALRNGVETGVPVGPGFELFDVLGSAPQFRISVPIEQSEQLEPGQAVSLVHPAAEWSAVTADSRLNLQAGSVTWNLVSPIGHGAPCGEDCEQLISTGEPTRVLANVVVVEPLTGPSLPVAAIRSSIAYGTHIQTPQGEIVTVTVVASDLGIAILDGVEVGQLAEVEGRP